IGELLEAQRDAIWGHKSLLEDGKIFYRDISENNIIITKATTQGASKRMLNSLPSGASHRIGTMQFMAIEVL
ncbi:hypothetical protein BDZ45DRAFT_772010, partial [Acephala macrosclerotiorum]